MPATIDLTEVDIFTAARSFLLGILPSGIEIIRGQDNKVPEPAGPDFVVLTPGPRRRLATNVETWSKTSPTTIAAKASTRVTIQCDVHGPNSADNAQMIETLWRSSYGATQFAASGFNVGPLDNSEAKQVPFLNGEQQYEYRWSIDLGLQANPVVTVAQDFANTLTAGVISVDASYPPQG